MFVISSKVLVKFIKLKYELHVISVNFSNIRCEYFSQNTPIKVDRKNNEITELSMIFSDLIVI